MAGQDATNIESLSLNISTNSSNASKGIEKLAATLSTLKNAVNVDEASVKALQGLSQAVQGLAGLNNIKLSSSVPKQLNAIGEAVRGLYGIQTSDITDLTVTLKQLGEVGSITLGPIVNQLKQLPEAAEGLKNVDPQEFKDKISGIAVALEPLSKLDKNNLTSYITQLGKLPQVVNELDDEKLNTFAEKIEKIAEALKPLGDEMTKVSGGFATMTNGIQQVNRQSISFSSSTGGGMIQTFTDLYHAAEVAYVSAQKVANEIMHFVKKQTEYVENVNLFNVSMGQYAESAAEYANTVRDVMGLDPSEWMRNQGIFMTLATGFGIATDRAATMSQQLTQLGYDLSSFFNDSFENAMLKLQSGLAGELEPLRRWGFDLSQAKLQQTALSLGIKGTIADMTQAEKAQLRYYAIMTQVTTAHGDMARTLQNPANSLRILSSELEQAARAIGGIFIPALQEILPYAIAVAKVVKVVADILAQLSGYEAPDFGGFELADAATGEIADNMEDASESAKELQRTIMGFDEINRLSDNAKTGSDASSEGVDGLDFELPTYDFLDGAIENRANELLKSMKEWLGLTEEINSWADFFDTKLGKILEVVGAIGGAFLLWKLSDLFLDTINKLTSTLSGNLMLAITGFAFEAVGAYDWGKNGASLKNVLETLICAAVGTAGLTKLGLSIGGATGGIIGLALGLGISLAVGYIAWEKGKEASYREQFWNSEAGKELAKLKEEAMERWDLIKEVHVTIKGALEGYEEAKAKWDYIQEIVDEIYDLAGKSNKLPSEIQELKDKIIELNAYNLDGIQLEYDETTQSINMTKDAVQELIDAQRNLALMEGAKEALTEVSKAYWTTRSNVVQLTEKQKQAWKTYESESDKLQNLKDKLAELDEQYKNGEISASTYQTRANGLNEAIRAQKVAVEEAQNTHMTFVSAIAEGKTAMDEASDGMTYLIDELSKLQGTNESVAAATDGHIASLIDENVEVDKANQLIKLYNSLLDTNNTTTEASTKALDELEIAMSDNNISVEEANSLIPLMSDALERAQQLTDNAKQSTERLTPEIEKVGESAKSAQDKISSYGNEASRIMGELPSAASSAASGVESAFGRISSTLSATLQQIRDVHSSMSNLPDNINTNMLKGNGLPTHFGSKTSSPRRFASGGVPEKGEMFVAREQGPELVGKIGNNSAVMNNGQIVQSVAIGVKDANESLYQAMLELLREDGEKDNKPINIYLGNELISQYIVKQNRRTALISGGKV